MKIMSGFLDDAYMAWLTTALSCCGASEEKAPVRGIEKPMRIEHHQPRLIPPPIPEEQERPTTRGREWVHRTRSFASRASSRGSFSVRRQLNAYNGPRRPRIGAPQDFRHVEEAMPMLSSRKEGFRPLELSIYMPENQLSPLLPHFGVDELRFPRDYEQDLPFPPATHSRSGSALSFRIPRKPVRSLSGSSSQWAANFRPRPGSLSAQELLAALELDLPRAPRPARLRSVTEPPAYERVKSALHEKYELEQRLRDIDVIIEERKSFYLNSRPSSRAASRPTSIYAESEEPMPPPPAPLKDSFAIRASSPTARPKTAPSKPVHIPTRLKSFTESSLAFTSHPPSPYEGRLSSTLPPPPPLPLILQAPIPHPPLRKKKSFSRVSKWLFPSSENSEDATPHNRTISMDTVTNTPKPITSREGFYQCIELQQQHQHSSTRDSISTVSTLESEIDEPTAPTSWATPDSSPGGAGGRKFDVLIKTLEIDVRGNEELVRARMLGESEKSEGEKWRVETVVPVKGHVPGRNSVGVAF